MKRSKALGLAVLGGLALTSTTCATASAATVPNLLPEPTTEKPLLTGIKSGKSTIGNGILEVTSQSSEGSLEANKSKLGSFVTELEETENVLTGTKCTGSSNTTTGVVTVAGTFHVRFYKVGSTLGIAGIILLSPVHFSCASVSVVMSGCVAGALTPENTLTKTLTLNFAKTGSDNTIVTVLNEENSAQEACQLLTKEGSGATKLSSLVSKQEFCPETAILAMS